MRIYLQFRVINPRRNHCTPMSSECVLFLSFPCKHENSSYARLFLFRKKHRCANNFLRFGSLVENSFQTIFFYFSITCCYCQWEVLEFLSYCSFHFSFCGFFSLRFTFIVELFTFCQSNFQFYIRTF